MLNFRVLNGSDARLFQSSIWIIVPALLIILVIVMTDGPGIMTYRSGYVLGLYVGLMLIIIDAQRKAIHAPRWILVVVAISLTAVGLAGAGAAIYFDLTDEDAIMAELLGHILLVGCLLSTGLRVAFVYIMSMKKMRNHEI